MWVRVLNMDTKQRACEHQYSKVNTLHLVNSDDGDQFMGFKSEFKLVGGSCEICIKCGHINDVVTRDLDWQI